MNFFACVRESSVTSKEADARPPVILCHGFGVDDDLVGKRVGVGGGNGWNVVLVTVHNGDDLVRGFLERFGHGASNLENIFDLISELLFAVYQHQKTYQFQSEAAQA